VNRKLVTQSVVYLLSLLPHHAAAARVSTLTALLRRGGRRGLLGTRPGLQPAGSISDGLHGAPSGVVLV